MILKQDSTAAFHIEHESFVLHAVTSPPELVQEDPITIDFRDRYEKDAVIGDIKGTISGARCTENGIRFTREFFTSSDSTYIAVRLTLENRKDETVELAHLFPFRLEGDDALLVNGRGLTDWRFVRNCRQKNDVPGSFTFTEQDANLQDAALDAKRIIAGGGITGRHADYLDYTTILAEPFFYIKSKHAEQKPGVFFGVIGQTEHLTSFIIAPTEDNRGLREIVCDCEFDRVLVEPGEARGTHWILITPVENETMMREQFTDIYIKEYAPGKPAKSPSVVYCTWQFYGHTFLPEDLDENLECIRKLAVPLDAFQLDSGWFGTFGDWEPNERFPAGMTVIADKIRDAGMMPGIWTAPLVVGEESALFKEHPELIAKRHDGEYVRFRTGRKPRYAVDPTHPYFEQFVNDLFGKLTDWGFTYHKLDFMRAIINDAEIRFHNRKMNRAQAYALANRLIRGALGDDGYIASCGGINDAGNAGLADAVRTSQDTYSYWVPPGGERWKGTLIKLKQNLVRNYTNMLWQLDPDAVAIRRRTEYFAPEREDLHKDLCLGLFTDEEAFTVCVNQYLCGGNVCVSERYKDLDDDRYALYRHFIPPIGVFARILDYTPARCPNLFLSTITPRAEGLAPWWTLAVANWYDEAREFEVDLSKAAFPEKIKDLAVFEFHDQAFCGIMDRTSSFKVKIPQHGIRLFRLCGWDGNRPVVLGTDLHFSGGGIELAAVEVREDTIKGQLDTSWDCPVRIHAAFPEAGAAKVVSTTIRAKDRAFCLERA